MLIGTLRNQISWNAAHQIPVSHLQEEITQLKQELVSFENVLASIQDRQERNIICCRYALGMNTHETAYQLSISRATVGRICKHYFSSGR